jgi:hypothetical protein
MPAWSVATFAPRSSFTRPAGLGGKGSSTLRGRLPYQSPVRPHLHAWMLREGEADLINRDRHSGGRTGVSIA